MGSCTRPADPTPFSTFSEYKFNDILTSLDAGSGDTLLVGTANGKIIFFNTGDAISREVKVGDDRVYFVRQDTLKTKPVTFVGVRNEGIKIFAGGRFSEPQVPPFGFKGNHYSVYRVERFGNWLVCTTSNGLAKLDLLHPDSLRAVQPDTVQPDYKINAIQRIGDTLYASHDTLLHVICLDGTTGPEYRGDRPFRNKILNLYADTSDATERLMIIQDSLIGYMDGTPGYKNILGAHSCLHNSSAEHPYLLMTDDRLLMGASLCPDSLTVCQLTLANEHYTPTANIIARTGFTYFISGSSLCQIPDFLPRKKHITAFAGDNGTLLAISDRNEVYSQSDNFHRRQVVRHNDIKDEISQAISFQNGLCVLSGGNVCFRVNGRNGVPLAKRCPQKFDQTKITRMYWDSNSRLLFLAFRNGFAYGDTKDGLINDNPDSLTSPLSVQCFAQPDRNTLYIGTLNDGCVVWDLSQKRITDTLFPHRTNITDIVLCQDRKRMFVLTPMALYADSIDGHAHHDSVGNLDRTDGSTIGSTTEQAF